MSVEGLVDHLFRRSAGQMVAALTRVLGPARLDVAEEAVQDALVRALELWPHGGVPADPQAWLFRVARNRAFDVLRRGSSYESKLALLSAEPQSREARAAHDDELAMVIMCCHPVLTREVQVTLTLKSVGGFSVREIAAAFLAEPAAVAQRLVRAKRTLAEAGVEFAMPSGAELTRRLGVVLDVLYLMFNEGYAAHAGDRLVRRELCGESIRLARLLCDDPHTATPAAHALLSLMLLQASRLDARTDADGDLLLLQDQDRRHWDRQLIAEGMRHLDRSAHGTELTRFHVQAAIAATHAAAPAAAATDWHRILLLYDQLMDVAPSPVVALNRAVAVARVRGAHDALEELSSLAEDPALRRYFPYPAAVAGLWLEAGRSEEAELWYRRALALASNPAERRFVERRIVECEASRSS
jgi:RNA polymerase sigma-70 factor, ECF subfamily